MSSATPPPDATDPRIHTQPALSPTPGVPSPERPPAPPPPAPSRRRRPTASLVLLLVAAAAVVGFLGGGLAGSLDLGLPGSSGNPGTSASPSATGTESASPGAASLTLTTDSATVRRDADIRLSGALTPAAGGVSLQVERRLDGGDWTEFPVTTTTRDDGSYSTVVRSGRVGVNDFRLVAEVEGERVESPVVTVRIT